LDRCQLVRRVQLERYPRRFGKRRHDAALDVVEPRFDLHRREALVEIEIGDHPHLRGSGVEREQAIDASIPGVPSKLSRSRSSVSAGSDCPVISALA